MIKIIFYVVGQILLLNGLRLSLFEFWEKKENGEKTDWFCHPFVVYGFLEVGFLWVMSFWR